MRACRLFTRSSALGVLRYAFLVGLLGARIAFAQSSAMMSCSHHNWDDDDDDDDDHSSSWTRSWCAGPTGSTGAGGASATSAGSNRGGGNTNVSTGGNELSNGSIAGIVIGVVAALILAALILLCVRRRYIRQRNLARRATLIGPAIATTAPPAGTKEGAQMSQTRTMANVAPFRPPGLHHSSSRDTLPQIPYDTPAYTSTDNLASSTYAQSHAPRASTVVSYASPSETTGVTAATAGHGSSNGYGPTSPHEDILARQKELGTTYEQKEMEELSSNNPAGASRPDHSIVHMNLPEHPPPGYNG